MRSKDQGPSQDGLYSEKIRVLVKRWREGEMGVGDWRGKLEYI